MRRRRPSDEPDAKSTETRRQRRENRCGPRSAWTVELRYVAVRRDIKTQRVEQTLGPFETPVAADRSIVASMQQQEDDGHKSHLSD